jgi:hypothetical protein
MLTYKTRWISAVYHLGRLAMVLLGAGILSLILWAMNRGLGLYDEGFALLAARYPDALQAWSGSFHIFTNAIFHALNFNVVLFRLSGLALLLMSWTFLGWGFLKAASRFFPGEIVSLLQKKAYTWSFLLLGVLLYYQWYVPTPSYNMLTAIFVNSFGGVLLLGWANLVASRRLTWIGGVCLAGSGAITALSFFNKFSVGFSLMGIAVAVLSCEKGLSVRDKTRGLASIMAGFTLAAGLYFALLQSPGAWWNMFNTGVKNTLQTSHSPAALLKAYLADFGSACLLALGYVWPALLAAGAWLVCLAVFKRRRPVLIALSPWVVCAILIGFTLRAFGLHLQVRENLLGRNVFGFYLAWLILLAVIGGVCRLTRGCLPGLSRPEAIRFLVLAGVLSVLPFAGMIGTLTPLSFNVQFYLGAWFTLMALGLALIAVWQRGTFIYYTGLVLVGMFAALQTAGYATTGRIYLGGHTLIEQKIPVQVGWPPSELRLDTDMAAAVQDLRSIAQAAGFQPGDDVVAIDLLPGFVYALGGRSPGIPFYRVDEMMSINQIGFRLTGADRLRRAFILTRTAALSRAAELMHSEGIAFPESYSNVGAMQMSAGEVFSLWRPNPARNVFVWETVYTHTEHLEIVGKEPYNEVGFVLPESLNRNGVYKLGLEYQTVEAAVPYSIVIQSPYNPKNIPLHYLLELTEKTRSVEIMFVTAMNVPGPNLILRNWSSMGKFIVSKVKLFRLGAVTP